MKKTITTTFVTLGATALVSQAATIFNGGNLDTAGNWTSGLPDAADEGSINVDGTLDGNQNFGGPHITTQIGGNLVGATTGFNFVGGTFNLTGGSISARFVLANGSTLNFTGGSVTTGNGTGGTQFKAGNNGSINVGGSVSIVATREITAANMQSGNGGTAGGANTTNYASDWTGSFTMAGYNAAKWEAALVDDNTFFNGVEIDSTVFNDNFLVVGDTLSLAPIPEPSSTALLGLGGLALILRRRK